MSIRVFIDKMIKRRRYKGIRRGLIGLYQKMIDQCNLKSSDESIMGGGINDWEAKWSRYDSSLSPLSYQIFSRYIGKDINIIPLEILAGIVEPVMTPEPYIAQYGDKNNIDRLYHGLSVPDTLVRNIEGIYYDKDYCPVDEPLGFIWDNHPEKIILKPTREESGHGVRLFTFKDGQYIDGEGDRLTMEYLNGSYKRNFIIQKAVSQSSFMSVFNPSSVNTLRIATYRSVKTGKVHVINAVMRIGASGKNVDNAHSGGKFIGIDYKTGIVGKYVCDWLGKTDSVFNGIDFSKESFQIPRWEEVCKFAVRVSERIIFGNLVALDIALDVNGEPILIETNVGGFSGWLFQFTTGSVFGEFTDEVMEYCYSKYKKLNCAIVIG